jgi:hypothetical protein
MKPGKLFCFVSHQDLPNHNALGCTLGIFGKLSMSREHQLGLRVFGIMVWKLLIVEPFFP